MVSVMSDRNNPGPKGNAIFDLQSKLDSEFSFEDDASVLPTVETQKVKPSHKTRFRALIVDDNVSFQKLLGLSLSMHPQIGPIDCADDGESAIEKAKAHHYDIIFMDAMMPGIDGYQACTRLRENPDYKNTPIIMVSGLTEPYDEAKAFIAGSTTYVTKPVQQIPFKALLSRVMHLLEYKNS
jgi:two-component system, cell cycle response regulator